MNTSVKPDLWLNGVIKSLSQQKGSRIAINENSDDSDAAYLIAFFVEELKDIYWAEKALLSLITGSVENASSIDLIEALCNHLDDTEVQVERIEQIFTHIGRKPVAVKSEIADNLMREFQEFMEDCEEGIMRDLAISIGLQKLESYEIKTYSTLIEYAELLELHPVIELLQLTIQEEIMIDERLSELAGMIVHGRNAA